MGAAGTFGCIWLRGDAKLYTVVVLMSMGYFALLLIVATRFGEDGLEWRRMWCSHTEDLSRSARFGAAHRGTTTVLAELAKMKMSYKSLEVQMIIDLSEAARAPVFSARTAAV